MTGPFISSQISMLTAPPMFSGGVGTPMPAAPAPAGGSFSQALGTAAPYMMVFGAIQSAVGSFYAMDSQKMQLKMQAQNQRFAANMARINQRLAAAQAEQVGSEGQKRVGQYTMRAGAQRGSARAAFAARGGVVGEGSSGEILGSMDVVKEIDKISMNAETIRQMEAQKLQAFNLGVGATMADVSAGNLSATADTIYPGLALGTSLLTSASQIGGTFARNRRVEELLAGISQSRF